MRLTQKPYSLDYNMYVKEEKCEELAYDYVNDQTRAISYLGTVIKEEGEWLSKHDPSLYEIDKLIDKGVFLYDDDFDMVVIRMNQLIKEVQRGK